MRRYADVVQDPLGTGQSGCTILVKVNGQPNAPLPQLYKDNGSTPESNPLFTDPLGRFAFYVADGRYDIEVSGPNIESYVLPDVLISESLGGGGTPGSGTGSMADQNANAVNITGGSISGVTLNGAQVGTMANQNANAVAITGGQLSGVTVSGSFSGSVDSDDVNITGGTINGILVSQIGAGGGGGGGVPGLDDPANVQITGGTIENVVIDDNEVVALLVNAIEPILGQQFRVNASQNRTFQATLSDAGTGDMRAVVDIEVSNDNQVFVQLARIEIDGTAPGPITEAFTSWAPWAWVRARLIELTGVNPSINVNMGD